jgi:hypothetical protein
MFVYIYWTEYSTQVWAFIWKDIIFQQQHLLRPYKSFKEICHTKTSPPQKSLNQPYTGYLFVFQIFFCAWETKEGSQQNVE